MELVTVICLCYNHAKYIEEAIDSVYQQDYTNIELIVVNDASTDDSSQVIYQLQKKYPSFIFINTIENKGMCKSFNSALSIAKGEFIIDLAADDCFTKDRVSTQVNEFKKLDARYGVVFSDAYIVDEVKNIKNTFYKRSQDGKLIENVAQGDVFETVLHSYKICSPTIMVRKSVFIELGGYDESLSYEDYDFFIRSSRKYNYHFIDKPLIYKREVDASLSKAFYKKKNNHHLESTLVVSKKALWLCEKESEKFALLHSVRYHYRQSYFLDNFKLALNYYELIREMGYGSIRDEVMSYLSEKKLSVYWLFSLYNRFRKCIA